MDEIPRVRSRRGLATASCVLRVLAFLAQRPEGVRADEVAEEVSKSVSTAYYLLASLCEEGFAVHDPGGVYRPTYAHSAPPAGSAPPRPDLSTAVGELFARTRKRAYLGVVGSGAIEITAVRGQQGVARMPGLGTRISSGAHALAMGKVVLARLPEAALRRYIARGLASFTPHTITSAPALVAELERVRREGFAVDREEFDADFCCVAAPVVGGHGGLRGILGVSMSRRAFDAERDEVVDVVRDVARFQHRAEIHEVLDREAALILRSETRSTEGRSSCEPSQHHEGP